MLRGAIGAQRANCDNGRTDKFICRGSFCALKKKVSKANCSIPTKVARGFPSSTSASEVSDENKPENAQNAAASKNTASSPLTSSKSAATAKADASSQPDSKVITEDCQ